MNIAGSADTALWQSAAAQHAKTRLPKLEPRVIAKEQVEGGVRTVIAMLYGGEGFYRLTPEDWALLQLFNGERTYEEVARLYSEQIGTTFTQEQVAEFVDAMRDTELLYKAPAERSLALMETLVRDRERRRRKKIDPADIVILTWNSNPYFDWLYPRLKFIYTRWFTYLTLGWFFFMGWILWDRVGELWSDSITYYNFTQKGFHDLVEFWFAFAFVVFFHESAHGLTCKHWGARVHRMGFSLFYLAPTFFCDVSEAYVYGGKWQRISIMFAGAWVELMMCTAAALVWWGTAPGMFAHDLAYKMLLVAGIAIIVLNLNPLIKLDGYYIFCELIGVPDLKERSTAYLSNWIRNAFGLPVRLDYLRRRRKWFYIVYGVLSGIYGYILLFVAVTITYNVFRSWVPEWAFLPAIGIALLMFKTPLRRFGSFMKTVYEAKVQRWKAILTPVPISVGSAALLLFMLLPIWRDTIQGRFILDAPARAILRAEVPGRVESINVVEGESVRAGTEIARLQNLPLQSRADSSAADLVIAGTKVRTAELQYAGLGKAEVERDRANKEIHAAEQETKRLILRSPIDGIVVSPRPQDLLGAFVKAGTELAEVAQQSPLCARVYVPEFAIRDLHMGAPGMLHFDNTFVSVEGQIAAVAPASSAIADGLAQKPSYKGEDVPNYFVADIYINNAGSLRAGMIGTAKILVRKRSALGFAWETLRNFAGRRFW